MKSASQVVFYVFCGYGFLMALVLRWVGEGVNEVARRCDVDLGIPTRLVYVQETQVYYSSCFSCSSHGMTSEHTVLVSPRPLDSISHRTRHDGVFRTTVAYADHNTTPTTTLEPSSSQPSAKHIIAECVHTLILLSVVS